jgi:hypothetical protein
MSVAREVTQPELCTKGWEETTEVSQGPASVETRLIPLKKLASASPSSSASSSGKFNRGSGFTLNALVGEAGSSSPFDSGTAAESDTSEQRGERGSQQLILLMAPRVSAADIERNSASHHAGIKTRGISLTSPRLAGRTRGSSRYEHQIIVSEPRESLVQPKTNARETPTKGIHVVTSVRSARQVDPKPAYSLTSV